MPGLRPVLLVVIAMPLLGCVRLLETGGAAAATDQRRAEPKHTPSGDLARLERGLLVDARPAERSSRRDSSCKPACSTSACGGPDGCGGSCPNTCLGCCDVKLTCLPGNTGPACGTEGLPCKTCGPTATCSSGSCIAGTCSGATCPGCCDAGGKCQPGTSTAACGSGGVACAVCLVYETCVDGGCAS